MRCKIFDDRYINQRESKVKTKAFNKNKNLSCYYPMKIDNELIRRTIKCHEGSCFVAHFGIEN